MSALNAYAVVLLVGPDEVHFQVVYTDTEEQAVIQVVERLRVHELNQLKAIRAMRLTKMNDHSPFYVLGKINVPRG